MSDCYNRYKTLITVVSGFGDCNVHFMFHFFGMLIMQRLIFTVLAFVSAVDVAVSTDYHIGPGQPFDELRDVAFHSLQAGDRVFIYAKPTPYFEKIRISGQGTSTSPIKVIGVPDASGNLPVLDATEATTHPNDI